MKAKNINGSIHLYSDDAFKNNFNNYTLSDGRSVMLFYLSDNEILEAEGFFDVVIPELIQNQYLGDIYFDEENRVYTYPVITKTQEEIDNENIPIVPQQVRSMNLRIVLIQNGISIEAIYETINLLNTPDNLLAYQMFEYATHYDRDNTIVNTLAEMMNITQEQLDNFFIQAQNIQL